MLIKICYITCLSVALLTSACAGSDTQEASKESKQAEHQITPNTIENNFDQQICACLDSSSLEDCYRYFDQQQAIPHDRILANPCYQEGKYKPVAKMVCDCLNSIEQASLECDEMQADHDELYSNAEKAIIKAFFAEMSCGNN